MVDETLPGQGRMGPGDVTTEEAKPHWLLLAHDRSWPDAVRQALRRLGGGYLDVAHTPQDTLSRLVQPNHPYTKLLLESSAAGPYLRDLVGVTAGETGSPVQLLLLGDGRGLSAQRGLRHAPTPADLARLLADPDEAEEQELPPLTIAELAISFRPDDLECRFQPIVRLADRRAVGMETLVRLQHPVRGTIGPDSFVPQIERGGLSLRLSEAVARCALRSMDPAFIAHNDLFLTINLPLDVLQFPEALQRIEDHRRASDIPVSRVLIELTESRPVMDLPGLREAVERWRGSGYRLAIDDMGPEMMNQAQLFNLPFNVVKLDKQIVLRSQQEPLALSYLQRTVESAHQRGLSVIAEGIEDEAMWHRVREMGVEYAQGFLIARAMPANALRAWAEAWSAHATPAANPLRA